VAEWSDRVDRTFSTEDWEQEESKRREWKPGKVDLAAAPARRTELEARVESQI
jgi:hypothetical protein